MECDFWLTHRRKISAENARYPLPFAGFLEARDFANHFRSCRNHFTIERVDRFGDFGMDGFVLFEAKLLRQGHLQRKALIDSESNDSRVRKRLCVHSARETHQ